jgi:hypothetical protein
MACVMLRTFRKGSLHYSRPGGALCVLASWAGLSERALGVEVGLGEGHELAGVFIPQL